MGISHQPSSDDARLRASDYTLRATIRRHKNGPIARTCLHLFIMSTRLSFASLQHRPALIGNTRSPQLPGGSIETTEP